MDDIDSILIEASSNSVEQVTNSVTNLLLEKEFVQISAKSVGRGDLDDFIFVFGALHENESLMQFLQNNFSEKINDVSDSAIMVQQSFSRGKFWVNVISFPEHGIAFGEVGVNYGLGYHMKYCEIDQLSACLLTE